MGKLIGVFATDMASRVQGKIYKALFDYFNTRGYTLVFFSAELDRRNFSDTDESASNLLDIAKRMDFVALFLHVESIQNKELIDQIIDIGKEKDIPVFVYDGDNYGYSSKAGVVSINPNYSQGFEDSVTHLIEHHGCKNIYMLAGTLGNIYSEERIAAYKKVMNAHGLVCSDDRIAYGGFWELPATKAIDELLEKIEKENLPFPEAICCANDSMAIATYRELIRKGYRVPEDILLTGFDGIEDGKFNYPAISTCEPILDAVPEYVCNAIEKNVRCDDYLIPLRFIPKESCGCENKFKIGDAQEMSKIMESARHNIWQHSMLSNLQLSLMNSVYIESLFGGMHNTINQFKGMGILYCIRDDLETVDDYTSDFDKLRIRMNVDFYDKACTEAFSEEEIIPDFDEIINNADGHEFFIFQILHSSFDRFGYSVIRSDKYVTNTIRIFCQFDESFTNMLEGVLGNIRLETATNKLNEMYQKMSEIYIRDVMTGLYNRTGYYKELEKYLNQYETKNGYIHVISIDMDGLKYINDNFGHQEGDIALQAVAKSICDCFDTNSVCARFGGDEFEVSVFNDSINEPSPVDISNALNNYLKALPSIQGKPYPVGVSVGHSVEKITENFEIKTLELIADECMYVNKRERKAKR